MQKMHITLIYLPFFKCILDMSGNVRLILFE